MSIIERALDKLDRNQPASPTPAPGKAGAGSLAVSERGSASVGNALDRAAESERLAQLDGVAAEGASSQAEPQHSAGDGSAPGKGGDELYIDFVKLGAAGFITPDTVNSLLGEQHRLIKRLVLKKATADSPQHVRNGNLIMVTSALPGEGKTFLSLNLAMSIAMEINRTVLLVDGDSVRSNVSSILGVGERAGLTDLLTTPQLSVADVLIKTDLPKLSVLPSGPHHANATELFASTKMRRLVEEIATRYHDRIVIFDSPPLLATSGSSVLAGLMGQIVFVVEAERTLHGHVQNALKMIEHCEHVGLVFNKSRERLDTKYGYGYGYGHKYGYGQSYYGG